VRPTWAIAALRVPPEDEFLQPRQRRVVVSERFVEPRHRLDLEQRIAGNRQLAAEVEELVLDDDEQLADVVGQGLGEEHAERRVELVDIAERGDAQMALGDAAAVAEAGRAVVAGPRRDLGQAIRHGRGILAAPT
jgi:hypothetical protein